MTFSMPSGAVTQVKALKDKATMLSARTSVEVSSSSSSATLVPKIIARRRFVGHPRMFAGVDLPGPRAGDGDELTGSAAQAHVMRDVGATGAALRCGARCGCGNDGTHYLPKSKRTYCRRRLPSCLCGIVTMVSPSRNGNRDVWVDLVALVVACYTSYRLQPRCRFASRRSFTRQVCASSSVATLT